MEKQLDESQSNNTVRAAMEEQLDALSVVDNPAQDEGTDEIVQSLPRRSLDDNGQRNWQEESRQYLDVHFPNWKDPKTTHMVPMVPPVCRQDAHQSASAGALAENKIFNLIKEFGQKYSEPMFVVHSCEFAALVENAEKGYCVREWAKGECDFVVIHRRLGLFFIEVKAAGNSRSVYKAGRIQIGKVTKAILSYCKKIFQGKKKPIEKEIFKYPGFVALPNCSKEESYDCGLFREDCQDVDSFKKWWDQKIVRSDRGICQDIYEALIVRLVALVHQVPPTLNIQVDKTHHQITTFTPKELEVMLGSCPKQWITGPAGSGKTVVLILKVKEVISSIMKKGKKERVLVLCYNRPLSVFLENEISAWFKNKYNDSVLPPEICTIKTYHSFLMKLGDFKTFPLQMSEISIIEKKYRDESPRDEDMYNHIFCDEGQDFPGCWTELLERFLKEDTNDIETRYYFWVMFDSCQHVQFSGERRPFRQSLKQAFRLEKVMRNTEKIFLESKKFFVGLFNEDIKLGHKEIGLNVQFDDSLLEDKSNSANVISKHIDLLLTEKVEKKDIIVLTRDKETRNVLTKELIDVRKAYEIENAEVRLKSGNNCISIDSIRRFKGLESKVVIVYDPYYSRITDAGYTSKARELLYVAMSRCFCYLVIVSTKEGCRTIKSGNIL